LVSLIWGFCRPTAGSGLGKTPASRLPEVGRGRRTPGGLQVVRGFEPGAEVIKKVALTEPTEFDAPDRIDAFLAVVQ
jgi:hypothetical protein